MIRIYQPEKFEVVELTSVFFAWVFHDFEFEPVDEFALDTAGRLMTALQLDILLCEMQEVVGTASFDFFLAEVQPVELLHDLVLQILDSPEYFEGFLVAWHILVQELLNH